MYMYMHRFCTGILSGVMAHVIACLLVEALKHCWVYCRLSVRLSNDSASRYRTSLWLPMGHTFLAVRER